MNRREAILTRIAERVNPEDRGYRVNGRVSLCHIWTGPTSGNGRGGGYGRMSLDGQTVAVHIAAYVSARGYVPSRKHLDHLCNQRACCNPDHLEVVTPRTNQRRRAATARENAIKEKWAALSPLPCPDCEQIPKVSTDNEGWTVIHCCRSISRYPTKPKAIRGWRDLCRGK